MKNRETLTKVSLAIEAIAILHNAAATLAKINRAKNALKGIETEDKALQDALDYVTTELRKGIGY